MKTLFFFLLLFFSFVSFSQKFAVIENKGENAKYFDYNNPNSFVGVLMNNLSVIPSMVANNNFQGVYDELMLKEIGVEQSYMLEFDLAPKLRIYRPFSEDTLDIIKTNQSFESYLDSVKNDEDFEMLFNIDNTKLRNYWNKATENSPVRIRTTYYFDIRNLKAFLIEQKDSVKWIHFVKSMPNGKSFISLSLTESQLKESNCFLFWQFLSDEESEILKSKFKKYQLESNILNDGWKKIESTFFNNLDDLIFLNEAGCSQNIAYGDVLYPFSDLFSEHFFKSSKKIEIQEVKYVQNIGYPLVIYRPWKEDTMNIVKTRQSFENFIDSMSLDQENEELLGIDREKLKMWWDATKLNDPVRKDPESIVLWRDAINSRVAISYQLFEGETIPAIKDIVIFSNKDGELIPIQQCGDVIGYDNSVSAYLRSLKLNVSVSQNWMNLLNTKTKKSKFSSIQKSLNLINNTTQF
jgi:hypothetical protein